MLSTSQLGTVSGSRVVVVVAAEIEAKVNEEDKDEEDCGSVRLGAVEMKVDDEEEQDDEHGSCSVGVL